MLRGKKPSESMDSWNIVPQIDLECVVNWMSRRSEKEKNKMFRMKHTGNTPEQNLMPLLGAGAILLVAGVAGLAAVFGPAGGCKPMER